MRWVYESLARAFLYNYSASRATTTDGWKFNHEDRIARLNNQIITISLSKCWRSQGQPAVADLLLTIQQTILTTLQNYTMNNYNYYNMILSKFISIFQSVNCGKSEFKINYLNWQKTLKVFHAPTLQQRQDTCQIVNDQSFQNVSEPRRKCLSFIANSCCGERFSSWYHEKRMALTSWIGAPKIT